MPANHESEPVHQYRLGKIVGTVWFNEDDNGRGTHTVQSARLNHPSNEECWPRASSFRRDDLPLVAKVADHCRCSIRAIVGQGGTMSNACPTDKLSAAAQHYSARVMSTAGFQPARSAIARQGGALHNGADSNPRLIHTIFAGNRSEEAGGAVYNDGDTLMALIHCTRAANDSRSGVGGGIASEGNNNTLYVTNSILWANTAFISENDQEKKITSAGVTVNITYRTVQGWPGNLSGAANSGANPQFITDPNDGSDGWGVGGNDDFGDLRLMPGSLAIDAGTNTADVDPIYNDGIQPLPATDLDGNPRIADLIVDMGAFESSATRPNPKSLAWLLDGFSGPGVAPSPTPPTTPVECLAPFDEDGDQDVDLRDFSVFALNGPALT